MNKDNFEVSQMKQISEEEQKFMVQHDSYTITTTINVLNGYMKI